MTNKKRPDSVGKDLDSKSLGDMSRRKTLKGLTIAGGAATVTHWKRPVVMGVVLPAHGASTAPGTDFTCGITADASGEMPITVRVSPVPPSPPPALIRCTLEVTGTEGTQNSAFRERHVDENGEATFMGYSFMDFSDLFFFPSGEGLQSVVAVKSCVNPDECDAVCELDVTNLFT